MCLSFSSMTYTKIKGVVLMTKYLTLQDPRKLKVLQLSIETVQKVGVIVEALPLDEGHIKDQLQRSSQSVVQNIAKGEQLHVKQKFNLYSIAIGSAQETRSLLMNCVGKGLISDGEYLVIDGAVENVISMLNNALEELKVSHPDVDLPAVIIQNIKTLPSFQKSQMLVKVLYEMENEDFDEWHYFVKKITINAACNISSHVSEAEQSYWNKKRNFLSLAYQEINTVIANLKLMSKGIKDKEKYQELDVLTWEILVTLKKEIEAM